LFCNPNNPTGKVFTRAGDGVYRGTFAQEFDALCFITDEIYEHILYPARRAPKIQHIFSMAQIEGMREAGQ